MIRAMRAWIALGSLILGTGFLIVSILKMYGVGQ